MPIVKMSAKVLVCGDVGGRFAALLKAVTSANAKAGPFDALFVVGSFFAADSEQAAAGEEEKLPASFPIPTYCIAGDERSSPPHALPDDGCELCPNLRYLGRQGVATVAGLTVAFLSGVFKSEAEFGADRPRLGAGGYDACYRKRDVDWLKSKCGRYIRFRVCKNRAVPALAVEGSCSKNILDRLRKLWQNAFSCLDIEMVSDSNFEFSHLFFAHGQVWMRREMFPIRLEQCLRVISA